MYVARPGIEPRTPDLRVRCPTDCGTRPGHKDDRRVVMKGSVSPVGSVYGWKDFRQRKSNPKPLGQ